MYLYGVYDMFDVGICIDIAHGLVMCLEHALETDFSVYSQK